MAQESVQAILNPRTKSEKYKNDFRLTLQGIEMDARKRVPKHADSLIREMHENVQKPFESFLGKTESIRTSGRYTADGERAELRLAAQAMHDHLTKFRASTADKIKTRLAEDRAAALRPKQTADPAMAMVRELRNREMRDQLRTLDKLQLQVRIRQAVNDGASTDFLDALEGAPAGFEIAPKQLVAEAREAIAERDHPELGELATLARQYEFLINSAHEAVKAAVEDAGPAPDAPVTDTRQPYTLSGTPLPGATA